MPERIAENPSCAIVGQSSSPGCYGLIGEYELPSLCYLFEAAARQREAVLKHWHRLYLLHLGESRSLSDALFLEIFGSLFDAITDGVTSQDIERSREAMRSTSERLRNHRVAFEELAVSMHVLEGSVLSALPHKSGPELVKLRLVLDRLTRCLSIVGAEAYLNVDSPNGHQLPDTSPCDFAEFSDLHGMIGTSAAMCALYRRIEMAGSIRSTVLIVGETGTGKELVAHAIHECGPEPDRPFVALNCAALPKQLIESELFGYKRGAFTGAREDHLGLFRAAEGSTLFLDEITEMGADVQSKLLRALQEKAVRPVGSEKEVPVNARVIASTNVDPEQAVQMGSLRADLYYRLQANVLRVPPLRERGDDIALLADHFLSQFNQKGARLRPIIAISEEAHAALKNYRWLGNVRELANAIESAATFAPGPVITSADLPAAVLRVPSLSGPVAPVDSTRTPYIEVPTWAYVERELVVRALHMAGGKQSRAAKMLKISRKKLHDAIVRYRLA